MVAKLRQQIADDETHKKIILNKCFNHEKVGSKNFMVTKWLVENEGSSFDMIFLNLASSCIIGNLVHDKDSTGLKVSRG